MISQSTVLMATPIALKATEKGIDLHERAGDIIKGLNETTVMATEYTEETVATALPAYTGTNPDHTEALEATTDIVADRIRNALYTISKKVKPAIVAIEQEMKLTLDPGNVSETIFRYIDINAVNIEPAFLKSPFFPKAAAPTFADINSVKVSDLIKGVYPAMSQEDLVELIALDVPELQTFFSNPSEVKRIYDSLFVEKYWYGLIHVDAITDGVINLNAPENFSFGNFRIMVIASLLLNKLVAQDDPLPGVTGVSLEEYRSSLTVARDLITTLLWRFGNIWETRAAAGVVILDDALRMTTTDHGSMAGKPVLQGTLSVGYNSAVLEMFASAEELSLSEFAVGYAYAKARGYHVKDIITDRDLICDAWIEYCNDVKAALFTQKSTVAEKAYARVMEGLYAKEEYTDTIDAMQDGIVPTQRVQARIAARLDPALFFQNLNLLDAVVRGENSLMNTPLAAVMAGAFDSPIAEEILTINAKTPAASIEQQRKILSSAIISVILKRLINP